MMKVQYTRVYDSSLKAAVTFSDKSFDPAKPPVVNKASHRGRVFGISLSAVVSSSSTQKWYPSQ